MSMEERDSPLGPLVLASDGTGALVYLGFARNEPRPGILRRLLEQGVVDPGAPGGLDAAWAQLEAYFQGRLTRFELPLAPRGTPFQQRVWQALQEIPFGETRSYGGLAKRLGNPLLTRAVGTANGANPISIIIPCHRVIGADGSLTGYAGGLDLKRSLLDFECNRVGLFGEAVSP
jgi:O-6-methylguanine DNA methyltransferase